MPPQPTHNIPNVFVAQERLGFGRQSQTMVMCLNNSTVNVVETHVTQFKSIFQSLKQDGQIASGIIATSHELPGNLKKVLNPFLALETKTKDELQRNLLNFDKYLEYLIADFEKGSSELSYEPSLEECYIDLNTNLMRNGQTIPTTDAINEWLLTENAPATIILGGYGTGKTTFSRKIARDLAHKYLTSPNKYGLRLPILLYLREFPRTHVDIEAFVIAHLKRRCQVINPDFAAFQTMNDAGLLLLIFDGFDEMVVRADGDTIRRNLAAIERFAVKSNAKVLMTSRPEFFRSIQEERDLFSSRDALARKRPQYKQIALLPLTQTQVELYLKKRIRPKDPTKDWTYFRDQINHIPGFQDLTKRPVLLEMIVKTLPTLIEENLEINRATLYNTYLRSEIARQQETKQRQLLINQEDRFYLMQAIARRFYTDNPAGLTAEQIQDVLKDEFSRQHREELEAHMRDFLTASFLIRENDQYRFSHRSIMEYLAARDLAEEIENQKPEIFRKYKLTPEVRDFLIDLKPDPDTTWRETLWTWIRQTAEQTKEEAGYLGGNAVTLSNFMKESFTGKDFQKTVLRGAILRRATCVDANFRGCNLEDSDLSDCDLRGADLTEVVLGNFICPSCATLIMPEEAFCGNCGANLSVLSLKVKGAIIFGAKGLNTKSQHSGGKDLRAWLLENGATEDQQTSLGYGEDHASVVDISSSGIVCPTCATTNDYNAITCITCGTSFSRKPEPVEYVCSECKAKIIPSLRFCGMCGLPLSQIQCRSCYTLNSREAKTCYRCHTRLAHIPFEIDEIPTKLAIPSILCPACGKINPTDAHLCQNCGHELGKDTEVKIICSNCRHRNGPGAAFCDNCGDPLSSPAGAWSPVPPPQRSSPTLRLQEEIGEEISCPRCGVISSPGEPFCGNCGATLAQNQVQPVNGILCPNCTTPIQSGAAFCDNCGAPLPAPPTPSLVGTNFANRYRILNKHGQGGFSIVYLAEDTVLLRSCLIKEALTTDPEEVDTLRQEAEILSRVNHPGLPKVYDTGIESAKRYSVVEYIQGRTLSELLKDNGFSPLPETLVVNWAIQICDILDYLHNQHPPIIVRDIKPENFVIRTKDDAVVLIDLSISRLYKPGKTKDTVALGTVGYAPPEQYGKGGQTDARSDIYGLGATLHQLLTGYDPTTNPYTFPNTLELNSSLNSEWNKVISKATQYRLDLRYQSAVEMKADLIELANLLGSETTKAVGTESGFRAFIKQFLPNRRKRE